MGAPQIILIVLYALSLGMVISKHGEEKTNEKYNAWAGLIGTAIQIGLLIWGGFFS